MKRFVDWVTNVNTTHYLWDRALDRIRIDDGNGDFQSIIGREARAQIIEMAGRLPDTCIACVAAAPTRSDCFTRFVTMPRWNHRRRAGWRGIASAKRGRASVIRVGTLRRVAWTKTLCCRVRMARSRRLIQFQRVWIMRRWTRARLLCVTWARAQYTYATDDER